MAISKTLGHTPPKTDSFWNPLTLKMFDCYLKNNKDACTYMKRLCKDNKGVFFKCSVGKKK